MNISNKRKRGRPRVICNLNQLMYLRGRGLSYRQISKKVNISKSKVYDILTEKKRGEYESSNKMRANGK